MDINLLDAGLCLVLLLFTIRGLLRGVMKEVAGILSIVLGIIIAGRFYRDLTPKIQEYITSPDTAEIAAYAAIFFAVVVIVAIVTLILRKIVTMAFSQLPDILLGGVIGLCKGIVICAIAIAIVEKVDKDSTLVDDSRLAGYLTQVTDTVRDYLPSIIKPSRIDII